MLIVAAGSVFASIGHALWDTIHLTIVAIGFAWLFRRLERVSSTQHTLFLLGVLPLLFVYLRAEFVAELPPWAMVICGPLATALIIGALLNPEHVCCREIIWRKASIVAISSVAAAVLFASVRSPDFAPEESFLLGIMELICLFFAIFIVRQVCTTE
jgi:hypothetical protein